MNAIAAALNEEQLAWLREFFSMQGPGRRILHLRKGEALFKKGGEAKQIFMVLRGQIRLVTVSPSGKAATLEICGPHRWLFEGAIESHHTYVHSAIALTESDVAAFDRRAFHNMLLNNPVLSTVALGDMAAQLEGMRLSLDDQILNPADKRLANSLLAMFGNRDVQTITIDATPTRLAEQIGATRQTVHRIIPQFLSKGILTKRDVERYNVHRGPLELFLDP